MTFPNQASNPPHPLVQPGPPPVPGGVRRRSRPLIIAVGVVALLVVIVVGGDLIQRHFDPPSAFPADWSTETFTVSPHPTSQQLSDAAGALQSDVAHLGGTQVKSAIHGSRIEIGVPPDQADALTPLDGRRLRPAVVLRLMQGTDVNSDPPPMGQECAGDDGPVFCDADRTGYGVPTTTFLTGSDVADATAAAAPGAGTWSVTVSFTGSGKQRYAQAMQAQGPYGLVSYAVQLDTASWALTPLTTPYAPHADGTIPGLTQQRAQRIAAVLRLCRSQVEITS